MSEIKLNDTQEMRSSLDGYKQIKPYSSEKIDDVRKSITDALQNKEIKKFENDEWIEIVGEITKGKYHNSEIPIIKVTEIKKVDMPENIFVLPPNKTYIPTSGIL